MKGNKQSNQINLLGKEEQQLRVDRLLAEMANQGIGSALISSNVNIYYLTGRVFRGYIYISAKSDSLIYFLRRPLHLEGEYISIRKPEDMAAHLAKLGLANDAALEFDSASYSEICRLAKAIGGDKPSANVSGALRKARAVKTAVEQDMLKMSGLKQTHVYTSIPHLYREGMRDIELQIEIERASRLDGCLGQFRVAGNDMELFMGNILTGENGDTPSPYDFAMGGEGMDPSLPVGANGSIIKPDMPVMVDINGNYTGYMTDMTRCFCAGEPSSEAQKLNALSAAICAELAKMMIPGTPASELYNRAAEMAKEAGYERFFMGHRYHAGFVGHGVGIEINELPVLAPRSKDIIQEGNVIAVEPKFVVPGLGAIGVENTYIVKADGGEKITLAPEDIVSLD